MPTLLLATILFGYYDNAIQNPLDRHTQMREHSTYANLTGAVRPWVEADWQLARELNLKVIVAWPSEFWYTIATDRPLILTLPMWCRIPDPATGDDTGWCGKTAADWLSLMATHRDQIAFIGVSDEYGCDGGGVWYPIDRDNCRRGHARIEANLEEVRTYLPGVKTHVNETSMWAGHFAAYRKRPWMLDYFGIKLPSADYIGFDCYTPFASCARSGTEIFPVDTLVNNWKPYMRPEQRIALIPRAFNGPYLGWNPAPSEVSVMAMQYYAYLRREPLVAVMLPFIWWTVPGVGSAGAAYVPEIRTTYEQIGVLLTGRPGPPPPAPPGVVTGLRIVRE